MDDRTEKLVERLRRNSGWRDMQRQCITDPEMLIEAADEITRLSTEIKQLRGLMSGSLVPNTTQTQYLWQSGPSTPTRKPV